MDQENTSTKEQSEGNLMGIQIGNNKARVIFIICCLVLIGTLVLFFYSQSRSDLTENGEQMLTQDDTDTNWSQKATDSTTENLNTYVEELDTQLAEEDLLAYERKSLLLKKAIALGTNRVDLQSPSMENLDESTSILRSLFEAESGSYNEDIMKFGTISAYIGLLNSTCFLPEIAKSYPLEYPELYDSLVEKGVHPRAALLLTTQEFAYTELNEQFINDASTVANRSYIVALYLHSFGDKYDAVVPRDSMKAEALFERLKTDHAKSATLEKILYTGAYRGTVDPALRLAYVNDIVNTYGNQIVSVKTNMAIDEQYEKAFETINSYANTEDTVSDAVSRVMNTLMYFESLHRRYDLDGGINPEVSTRLVDTFIENAQSSKELQSMVSTYFTVEPNEEDWLAVRAGFMKAAVNYPKLSQFFSEVLGTELK
jgi:cell division protein FtsL